MQEEWRPVKNWEDRYKVSNTGKVWSILKDREIGGLNGNGYLFVKLYRPYEVYEVSVHRLIAETFIQPLGELVVHHKDFNKTNNNVDNLQIMTQSEHIKLHLEHDGRKNRSKAIKVYNGETGEYLRFYESMSIAAKELNCTPGEISRSLREGYKVRGYRFSYMDVDYCVDHKGLKVGEKPQKSPKTTIQVFDKDDMLVGEFHTLRETGEFIGKTAEAVRQAIKNNRRCGEYSFIKISK